MPRIIDNKTRIIDADFGGVTASMSRDGGDDVPNSVNFLRNGADQIIASLGATQQRAGSFIQYTRVDLSFMLQNNELVLPVDVSVQRTSPVPLGGSNNGNNFDQIEEYIFVLSRPLNNTTIGAAPVEFLNTFRPFRDMGLDSSESFTTAKNIQGDLAGWPTKAQTIYAEKRLYSVNLNNAATVANGQLPTLSDPVEPTQFVTLTGMPTLDSVTTWGSMDPITGPNLHVYRVVIIPSQDFSFVPNITLIQGYAGLTSYEFPPVNVSFLCKDPSYSEGEYLTTLANQVNSTPIGGDTA